MGQANSPPIDDHGQLNGLGDDDHSQYALADGSRGAFASEAQGTLADSAVQPGDLADVATSGDYDDLINRPVEYIPVALSPNASAIEAGTGKGFIPIDFAGTIVSFRIQCDPANNPSAIAVQVDLNSVDLSTGAATSLLSSVASIATGANAGEGTISGSPTVTAGDLLSCDVDQGSDGQDLIAIVGIQRT